MTINELIAELGKLNETYKIMTQKEFQKTYPAIWKDYNDRLSLMDDDALDFVATLFEKGADFGYLFCKSVIPSENLTREQKGKGMKRIIIGARCGEKYLQNSGPSHYNEHFSSSDYHHTFKRLADKAIYDEDFNIGIRALANLIEGYKIRIIDVIDMELANSLDFSALRGIQGILGGLKICDALTDNDLYDELVRRGYKGEMERAEILGKDKSRNNEG